MLTKLQIRSGQALLGMGLLVGIVPTGAALTISETETFNLNIARQDLTPPAGGLTENNIPAGTLEFDQFDLSNGILTEVVITLGSNRTQTISGGGNRTGTGTATREAFGSGSTSGVSIQAPGGLTASNSAALSTSGSCQVTGSTSSCTYSVPGASVVTNAGISASDNPTLTTYTGNGTYDIAQMVSSVSVESGDNPGTATPVLPQTNATYNLDWDGAVTVNYNYLTHANPSFSDTADSNTRTIDFGTVAQGEGSGSLSRDFDIFNLVDALGDTTGLDLDDFIPMGSSGQFSTDLALFQALEAGGGGRTFSVSFDTNTLGTFTATYVLDLSDEDRGVGTTGGYTLTLNLRGRVGPTQIPEPTILALLGVGLGMLGIRRRRC